VPYEASLPAKARRHSSLLPGHACTYVHQLSSGQITPAIGYRQRLLCGRAHERCTQLMAPPMALNFIRVQDRIVRHHPAARQLPAPSTSLCAAWNGVRTLLLGGGHGRLQLAGTSLALQHVDGEATISETHVRKPFMQLSFQQEATLPAVHLACQLLPGSDPHALSSASSLSDQPLVTVALRLESLCKSLRPAKCQS